MAFDRATKNTLENLEKDNEYISIGNVVMQVLVNILRDKLNQRCSKINDEVYEQFFIDLENILSLDTHLRNEIDIHYN